MKKLAHRLALIGAFLQLSPLIGWLVMRQRMTSAVSGLNVNETDMQILITSISAATNQLGQSVDPLSWGFGAAWIGAVLFTTAITIGCYRRAWAFWFACLYGGLLTFGFPLGTLLGLFLLMYALGHRQEFGVPVPAPAVATA